MLRDLFSPSRITDRTAVAIHQLRTARRTVIDQVNAMAATPFKVDSASGK